MSQNQIILNIFQTKFTTHLSLKNGAFSIPSTLNDILIKLVMQARDPGEQCAGTTSLLTCESQWCIFLPIPNRWHHADMLKFALMGILIPWKLANRTISALTIFIFFFYQGTSLSAHPWGHSPWQLFSFSNSSQMFQGFIDV